MSIRDVWENPDIPDTPIEGEEGWLGVIVPVARRNLVTNPTVALASTGYTAAGGASIARTAGVGRRSSHAIVVTPTSASDAGVYWTINLTAGTYAISVDLRGAPGITYDLSVRTTAPATLTSIRHTATGLWDRVWLPYVESGTNTRRIYLTKIGANTATFVTDGWQCELCGSEGTFPTTYIDGAQRGLVPNEFPPPYGWLGAPYSSISYRTGQTRAGGRDMNWRAWFGFTLISVVGLGLVPPQLDAIPYSQLDGAIYQRTRKAERQFTLVGRVDGATFAEVQGQLADLQALIDRDEASLDQPLVLTWQMYDDERPISEPLQITANYAGGLEGNLNNLTGQATAITFRQFLPFVAGVDGGTALTVQQSIASVNAILERTPSGQWQLMGTGLSGLSPSAGRSVLRAADGLLYVGGQFTDAGGSGADYLARWDPAARTWSAVGSATAINQPVEVLLQAPGGPIYVGGGFTNANGIAAADYIAQWNPATSTWSALGAGVGAGYTVQAATLGRDGRLYVGSLAAWATADYMAQFNPATSTWSAVGSATAINAPVNALATGIDGTVFVGGQFTNAGGVAAADYLARWNPTTSTWSSIGTPNGVVNALAVGPDGTLYAGGLFTSIDGVAANYIAAWNGSQWRPLAEGVNWPGGAPQVGDLAIDAQGLLYVSGVFTQVGPGIPVINNFAIWNGATWLLPDVTLPAGGTSVIVSPQPDGSLIMAFEGAGTVTATALTTVTNAGDARTYPTVRITGGATTSQIYQLINTTTGRAIYFNYALTAGEILTLQFTPDNLSFQSNTRGNIEAALLPGSQQADFFLAPGANTISMLAGASDVTAVMTWPTRYNTVTAAIQR